MSHPMTPMTRKPPVDFTPDRKEQFLREYRATGMQYIAAERTGITTRTVNQHVKDDPEFAEQYAEAKQAWVDEQLIAAAFKRGVTGVQRAVYGGRFKDEVVGTEIEYSDGLLLALLRANRAEFKGGADAAAGPGGGGGGVLIVPTAPQTMDAWESQFSEAAKGQTGRADAK